MYIIKAGNKCGNVCVHWYQPERGCEATGERLGKVQFMFR